MEEISRIQAEMRTILDKQGYTSKSVAEHMIDLTKEERFQYPNTDDARAQIIKDYHEIIDEINKNIGKMFNS